MAYRVYAMDFSFYMLSGLERRRRRLQQAAPLAPGVPRHGTASRGPSPLGRIEPASINILNINIYLPKETALDDFGGKGRTHDMVLIGNTQAARMLIAIEAKADESFRQSLSAGFVDQIRRFFDRFGTVVLRTPGACAPSRIPLLRPLPVRPRCRARPLLSRLQPMPLSHAKVSPHERLLSL